MQVGRRISSKRKPQNSISSNHRRKILEQSGVELLFGAILQQIF